ncbi:hypothetical protein VIBHAR_00178 [Vibrio campbellii ATCC BAA-1116]|uniref:Uncharacterized protein n=1 Tax=Vibrio campbellii (strain ATCC BAA-1116) TaxID=2902295 RepID=A7N083_VIBC1|nr:hypothetical protein VIBHAR_00178 [Vibrio campbellii ATCC BAA-1116]
MVKQQQFEYAYLFGSVCPERGIGEAIVVPWVNKDIIAYFGAFRSVISGLSDHPFRF